MFDENVLTGAFTSEAVPGPLVKPLVHVSPVQVIVTGVRVALT